MSFGQFPSSRTNAYYVELKATLKEFALNLVCDAIEADMCLGHHNRWSRLLRGHGGRHRDRVQINGMMYQRISKRTLIEVYVDVAVSSNIYKVKLGKRFSKVLKGAR